MNDMKAMARPFLTLYAMALVIAILARIGLTVAGGTGVLAFDYISASGVPILDVICSILTGSAFVAFLFAAGLALVVSTAGPVLYGVLAARGDARPRRAFPGGGPHRGLRGLRRGGHGAHGGHLLGPERGGGEPAGARRLGGGRPGCERDPALWLCGPYPQAGGRPGAEGERETNGGRRCRVGRGRPFPVRDGGLDRDRRRPRLPASSLASGPFASAENEWVASF